MLLRVYQIQLFNLDYVPIKLVQNQNTCAHGMDKVMDKACVLMDESAQHKITTKNNHTQISGKIFSSSMSTFKGGEAAGHASYL